MTVPRDLDDPTSEAEAAETIRLHLSGRRTSRPAANEYDERITELNAQGLNDREISDALGITLYRVWSRRNMLGLPSSYRRERSAA